MPKKCKKKKATPPKKIEKIKLGTSIEIKEYSYKMEVEAILWSIQISVAE